MQTTKQTFQFKDKDTGTFKDDVTAEHETALLNIDYFVTLTDNKTGQKVRICLYNLKSIMRTANKNIKEITRL